MARRLRLLLLLIPLACNGQDGDCDEASFEPARQHALTLVQTPGTDPRDTAEAIQAALAICPDHYGLNMRVANIYADMRLHEQAMQHFERAWRSRPEDLPTLLSIVTLKVRFGQLDEAAALLPALLDDPSLRGEALYQQATILDLQGRRDEALEVLEQVGTLSPPQAYRGNAMLGRLLLEQGRIAEARQRFEASLAGRADYKESLRGLADSCRRLDLVDEAAHWDRVLRLFVELTDNVLMSTPAWDDRRRAVLEQIVALHPSWAKGFPPLAELQQQQGDAEAACATVEAYLVHHPDMLGPDGGAALRQRYCGGSP